MIADKERKILVVFADMIAGMCSKKLLTELFIRDRKLNISLVFIILFGCTKIS